MTTPPPNTPFDGQRIVQDLIALGVSEAMRAAAALSQPRQSPPAPKPASNENGDAAKETISATQQAYAEKKPAEASVCACDATAVENIADDVAALRHEISALNGKLDAVLVLLRNDR